MLQTSASLITNCTLVVIISNHMILFYMWHSQNQKNMGQWKYSINVVSGCYMQPLYDSLSFPILSWRREMPFFFFFLKKRKIFHPKWQLNHRFPFGEDCPWWCLSVWQWGALPPDAWRNSESLTQPTAQVDRSGDVEDDKSKVQLQLQSCKLLQGSPVRAWPLEQKSPGLQSLAVT